NQIGIAIHISTLSDKALSDTQLWKKQVWELFNRLSLREQQEQRTLLNIFNFKVCKDQSRKPNLLNKQLLRSKPVQNLYITLRTAYHYLVYREWIDANMSLL
ncbi:hypothetical protein, partial [Ruminococcus sp.]|uniref:hypothetical protein n=1 Tax=Ruminococcus sp. TaxID=41978 RepID=UPI002582A39A